MYLCKDLTDASLLEIGRQFGGKHHATVMHSIERVSEIRQYDKDVNRMLEKMSEVLSQ